MLGKLSLSRRAQSTAEYAIVIGLVIAAVIAMQTYVKRGLQAKSYNATQDFSKNVIQSGNWDFGGNTTTKPAYTLQEYGQYEPDIVQSKMTQEIKAEQQSSDMTKEGVVTKASYQKTTQAATDFQKQTYDATGGPANTP